MDDVLAQTESEDTLSFPRGFVWGAGASSYQIEGAATEDGKGPSIWDTMCQKKAAIYGGQTGDVACDHYHRYQGDVRVMQEINLAAYRLSVSWPRVIPDGIGKVNTKGLDFYDRLVDALMASGITPYVTLFHWDFPQALYLRNGWLNRESADWFAGYATVLVERISDRVKHWITINEPQVFLHHGHLEGVHAPGDRLSLKQVLDAGHNVLRAHGKAIQAIRGASKGDCQVGYAPVGVVRIPETDSKQDLEAASRSMFSVAEGHLFNNTWWIDPVLCGGYPEQGLQLYGESAPTILAGDMETIHQQLDFLGLNIYFGERLRANALGEPEMLPHGAGKPLTAMGTAVTPEALYWGPKLLWERYGIPIYITENGMSNCDWIALDGEVHDPQRIDFLRRYLLQLRRAVDDGADVRGYFHWSILDNFEWANGYKERFGLVYVDYSNQRRVLKDSARWYRSVIGTNGESLDMNPPGVRQT